jgi:hypothetical protein
MVFGLASEQSAAIVPIISYSLLGFPLFLLSKIISRPIAGYLTCIISLLCGKYLLYISTYAWTDMPYLLISVLAMLFLAIYNKYGSLSSITIAGIFTLLAELTRYIGITLFMAGIIVIIMGSKRDINRSITSLVSYCLISIVPFIIWIAISDKTYDITASSSNPSIDVVIFKFVIIIAQIFRLDCESMMIMIVFASLFVFTSLFILIHLNFKKQLINFIKDTIPLTSYVLIYSTVLIIIKSSLLISVEGGAINIRLVVQIYPFIILLLVSLGIFYYDRLNNQTHKILFKTVSFILLICLLAHGTNSLYSQVYEIRTKSIDDCSDRNALNQYMFKYNLTPDNICIDRSIDWPKFQMTLFSHQIQSQYKLINNNIPGETILDRITGKSPPASSTATNIGKMIESKSVSSTTLADIVRENKNRPIYLISSIEVIQNYIEKSSNDICLINPAMFSKAFIGRMDLRNNGTCIASSKNNIQKVMEDANIKHTSAVSKVDGVSLTTQYEILREDIAAMIRGMFKHYMEG